jgi:hypothetical protein
VIALRLLAAVLGSAVVVAVAISALKTVVVPRNVGSAITRTVFLVLRRAFFDHWLARPSLPFDVRERRLAYYAPIGLMALPAVWVVLALLGFTAIQWAVDPGLLEAFKISGSALFTLGFDVHDDRGSLIVTYAEAALGLGLVGLLITFLPTLYGAFNRRETLVGQLEVRAGLPPSPAELLVRYARIGLLEEIDTELFEEWERWFLDVEESHTTFPSLVFFRSPQPGRSWVTAAGCVLDVASLYLALVDGRRGGRTAIMLRTGFLALRRVADYFGVPYDPDPPPDGPISIERREFDLLCVELQAAGVPMRRDLDRAWHDFAGWRVNYDSVLLALAAITVAPPARWSSDRALPLVSRGILRRRVR